jgi:anti-sigma-K factor RskA
MNYQRPELLDRLASEYALGTLRGRALRRFERLLRDSAQARAAVDEWHTRLGRLAMSVPAVAPPERVWSAIERATGTAAPAPRKASWFASWLKPALGFAFGVAATIGLVQLQPQQFVTLDELAQKQQALPQSYVGLLTDKDNLPTVLVSSTRHGKRVTVKFLRPVEVPAGKVLQVWALPKEGAPFPLGTTGTARPPGKTEFDISATSEQLLSNVTRLAVSFEDAPATAQSKPSEFVLSGFCVKLW